jgi:hypothetical protein
MASKQRFPHVTITVPPGTRERMRDAPGVNWSAVAAQAFERRLAEIDQPKEDHDQGSEKRR